MKSGFVDHVTAHLEKFKNHVKNKINKNLQWLKYFHPFS